MVARRKPKLTLVEAETERVKEKTEPVTATTLTEAPVVEVTDVIEETAEQKAERECILAEVAALDDVTYESQRVAIAKKLGGWRVGKLDQERDRRRTADQGANPPPPPPPTLEELAEAAKDIIAAPDVLEVFKACIGRTLAGEVRASKLVYLCCTSRLFKKPMNLAIKGLSAIGKSHLRDRVLEFIPPDEVVCFTSMTEKALIYLPGSLPHKILSMDEAVGNKDNEFQDYLLREIISGGRINHLVTVPGGPGELPTTHVKTVAGPIMFVTTTTRTRLHPEIETRILSVETDDTYMQTRRVLEKVAEIEGGLGDSGTPDLTPWHAFQRWLAAGERRVAIPFASVLASHPDLYDKGVRMRRDFRQVLSAVQAHALLHRAHRERDAEGRIVATIDDYGAVYDLMADRLAQGAGTKLTKNDLRFTSVAPLRTVPVIAVTRVPEPASFKASLAGSPSRQVAASSNGRQPRHGGFDSTPGDSASACSPSVHVGAVGL